jgi:oligoendopeptidase F
MRRWRNQRALDLSQNAELDTELARLRARYQALTTALAADWGGQSLSMQQVAAKLEEADRSVRERALRLHASTYLQARDELAEIFDAMVRLRQRIAHNAGFDNYRDFARQGLHRFDYTVRDCQRWHGGRGGGRTSGGADGC